MGGNVFAVLLMLFLTLSGGNSNNDLLDLIPTDAYWRAKGVTVTVDQLVADTKSSAAPGGDAAKLAKDLESLSKRDAAKKQLEAMGSAAIDAVRAEIDSNDPEAAQMARDILKTISNNGKAGDIRRLMAIRTLGERKEASAVAALKALTDSKEQFVADYANRALSQIDGKPLKAIDHHADLAKDLDMLPDRAGIVVQTTGFGRPGTGIETFVTTLMSAQRPGAAPDAAEKQRRIDESVADILKYAEQIGNVRADGLTLAVSADIGGNDDWFCFSVHGQYDRKAVADLVQSLGRDKAPVELRGDAMIIPMDREAIVLMPSDRQFILAVSNPRNTPVRPLIEPMLDAATGGKPNTLSDNKALSVLLKNVDKTGMVWGAAMINGPMKRELGMIRPFDSIGFSAKDDGKAIVVSAKATGDAPAGDAIDEINAMRNSMIPKLKDAAGQVAQLQLLVDALQSVKVETDDKTRITTGSATVTREIDTLLMMGLMSVTGMRAAPAPAGRPPMIRDDIDLP